MERLEVINPFINKKEEKFLKNIAERTYKFIHPDVATLFAVMSSLVSFVLYVYLNGNPISYFLCSLAVIAHYVFDGIDGKIAKLRCMSRKNGYFIDKISDYISSCFFVAGFFYALTRNVFTVGFLLVLTSVVHAIYLHYYLKRGVNVKIGGTESRIVLIALNMYMLAKSYL